MTFWETAPKTQTYSLLLGGLEMGYFGVDFSLGQDAASIPPPTSTKNAPAQAMKMAEPNSYLQRQGQSTGKPASAGRNTSSAAVMDTDILKGIVYVLGIDGGERVVEGSDDVMTVPGTGNDGTQRCGREQRSVVRSHDGGSTGKRKRPLTANQEDDAASHGNAGLSCLVISSAGCALHAHAGDTQTCHGYNDADDHEGTGRLERS